MFFPGSIDMAKMKYQFFISVLLSLSFTCNGQTVTSGWQIFRGNSDLTGKTDQELSEKPNLVWSLPTGGSTKSSPVVDNGLIYFGNDKGTLFAVTIDGKIKWEYDGKSPIDAAPLISGNKVIFSSSDGILKAADRSTGKLLWSYPTENQIAGSANIFIKGNRSYIIVGSYDYNLHCVDSETGKPAWKVETDNFINGTPAVADNRIVFGGCDGIIRIVDPSTGKQKDTADIGVYIAASPALYGGKAIFGDYDGSLYCLNIVTKRKDWKITGSAESGSILAIPAAGNGITVVGSEDKYLYCYNIADGKLKWKFRTNGRIVGSAVLTPERVLFASTDGNVYILRQSDGTKIWSFNAGTSITSSPAVVKNNFYFLTEDGRLLSFR